MDVRWLEDFLAFASTGNFTRAAEERQVSQAAFSRRIKTLESWLRKTLIDRTTYPARLTRHGEIFREQAAEILQQIVEARLSRDSADPARRKQVRIAIVYSLASGSLPVWWSDWLAAAGPDVMCIVVSGNASDSVAALTTGGADILVCYQSQQAEAALPTEFYDHAVIGRETIAPYAAPQLVPWGVDLLPGQKGAPVPLLMYSRKSSFARVAEGIIHGAPQKLIGRVVMRAETSSVLRAMAVAGHGVAWLPGSVADEAPQGSLQRVGFKEWSAPMDIVAYRDKNVAFPALDRLWKLFLARSIADRTATTSLQARQPHLAPRRADP